MNKKYESKIRICKGNDNMTTEYAVSPSYGFQGSEDNDQNTGRDDENKDSNYYCS